MKMSIHLVPSYFRAFTPSCYRAISHWFACNERDFSEVTLYWITILVWGMANLRIKPLKVVIP